MFQLGILTLILFLLPMPALASEGPPIVLPGWQLIMLALAPVIIAIETFVFYKRGFPIPRSLVSSIIAKAISIFFGVPWVGVLFVGLSQLIGFGVFAVAHIEPVDFGYYAIFYSRGEEYIFPIALLIHLFVFFWAFYVIETWVVRRMVRKRSRDETRRSCFFANAASCSLLALVPIIFLINPESQDRFVNFAADRLPAKCGLFANTLGCYRASELSAHGFDVHPGEILNQIGRWREQTMERLSCLFENGVKNDTTGGRSCTRRSGS